MGNYTKSFNFRNGVQVDDSNFIVNANGLVGIGTSIPEKRLDVRGNAKIIGDTTLVGLTSITNLNVVGVVTIGSAVKIDSGSGIITATKFVGDASGLQNIVAIATDGFIANAGTLSTTAKIGIGTTNPTSLLDVKGNISGSSLNVAGVSTFRESVNLKKTINDTYSSTTSITPIITIRNDAGVDNTYSGLRLQAHNSNAAAATFDISVLNSSDNYKSTLVFQSKDGESAFSEKLRIDQDGKVGINSTIPAVNGIDLIGPSSGNGEIKASRDGGASILTQAQANLGRFGTSSNHNLQLMANNNGVVNITTGGEVGIGTEIPAHKLDVIGAIRSNLSTPSLYLQTTGTSTGSAIIRFGDADSFQRGAIQYDFSGNNHLRFRMGGAGNNVERMTIVGSTGAVGIGSTIPTAKLDVNGNTELDDLNVSGVSTFKDDVHIDADNKKLKIGDGSDLQLYHTGNRSEIINDNGDLIIQPGINSSLLLRSQTGSPHFKGVHAAEVEIYHNGIKRIKTTASGVEITDDLNVSGVSTFAGITTVTGDTLFAKDISVSGVITATEFFGEINTTLERLEVNTLKVNGISTFVGLSTFNNGIVVESGISTFRDNIIVSSGNVGIGTDIPNSRLHVKGQGDEIITLKLEPGTTAGNYSELVLGRTSSAPTVQTTPVVKGGIPISGVPGILFGSENTNLPMIGFQTPNSENGHILFKPKGSEKVRITSDGKVGINTAIPTADFEVTGNPGTATTIFINSSDPASTVAAEAVLKFGYGHSGTPDAEGFIKLVESAVNSFNGNMLFEVPYNNSGTPATREALRITSDGKIGIGTTVPAHHLHLFGTDANLQFRVTKEGVGSFNHGVDSTGAFLETLENDDIPIRFFTGGDERLRITSDGKISIGTINTTPSAAVHIDYESNNLLMLDNATGATQKMFFAQNGGTHAQIYATSASGGLTIESDPSANHDNSFIDFRVDNDEKVRITSTGEVNIGDDYSQTTYKMKVTGTVAATNFDSLSDQKLKLNIKKIEKPIETVNKIDGVTFNWKEDNSPSMGVIAQNIEKVLPEIVSGDDTKSVNYSGLIGLLIEVVKDQQKQINELRDRLDK